MKTSRGMLHIKKIKFKDRETVKVDREGKTQYIQRI
jgi:hypothetical protein